MIVDCSAARVPDLVNTDVVVIGSGAGGATAAWDLAHGGREVVVLEEGGDRTGRALTQRDGEMYDQLYMDRGGRLTDDLGVSVLQGRALGGGTVINASDVVPIPNEVLEHWVSRFGLTDFSPRAMAPHRARAMADLSATPIAEGQLNCANRLLRDGALGLGLSAGPMMHNRVGCVGLGTCLIGCPRDAKRNTRMVAIPSALQQGATVFIRARVVRIEGADQERKTLVVHTLDSRGHHEVGAFTVRANTVILAANAVGSAALLLRSGVGNRHVGRHLSLQPQLPVFALFEESLDAYLGIPQAIAVDEFESLHPEHGLWGFRIEAVMGTPGIVASLLPFAGARAKEMMTHYDRIAPSLLLAPDLPVGTVSVTRSGRISIAYPVADDLRERWRTAVRMAGRIYFAAGARQVVVPTFPPVVAHTESELSAFDDFAFAPASAPLLSAHQQGGVRMATGERDGAADPEGRVFGTRGVYCFDSGLYPSSSSSHTMTPIITTSHALSQRLLSS